MTFNIIVISVQSTDAPTMAAPAQRLNEIGIENRTMAFNSTDIDDDIELYHDLVAFTSQADFVFIRCMSDPSKFHRFDRYEKVLRDSKALVLLYSGNAEVTMLNRSLFKGNDEQFKCMTKYAANRGAENEYALYLCAARTLGLTDVPLPDIKENPVDGIYVPGYDGTPTVGWILSTFDPNKPTVGIMFTSSNMIYHNTDHIDKAIEILGSMGMNVYPIFYTALSYAVEGNPGAKGSIEKYFMRNGESLIDALILFTTFSVLGSSKTVKGVGTVDEENFFHTLTNVPVFVALGVSDKYDDFENDKIGLNKHDLSSGVAFSEIDGDIIGYPLSYTPRRSGMKKAVPVPDRVTRMGELVCNWARLRKKPVEDRKIAILMWQSRPDSGRIGNAAGLDTPESIANVLQKFDKAGYKVDNVPENGRQLIDEILDGVTNDLDSMSSESLREKAVDFVTEKEYSKDFNALPEWVREQMLKDWGKPPGNICVDRGEMVIPGLIKGNIFIGYQPLRGTADKMEENIHDPVVFAQHQYLAYYRWLRDVFKADMVIHVGTHGTIEWLPGKNCGLSAKCDPDVVLGALPNLYIYIVDDPGEGICCKRRINSVLDGHMPPSMGRAGKYKEILDVDVPLQEYFKRKNGASPELRAELVKQVYESAKEHNLFNDLNITEDPGAENFEQYITDLHEYLSEVSDALVRCDLHILGKVPRDSHFDEMVYSLTRLDTGDIHSLRNAFAANMGIDMDEIIDNPCETGANGELNSITADRIDGELQEFIKFMRECGYDFDKICNKIIHDYGKISDDLKNTLKYTVETLVPNINRMDDEVGCLIRGSNGEFILPGPSGAPTRGNADILPMGRNYYTSDPDTIPSKASWAIGSRMADQMIEKYTSEKGEFPREVGFIIWATDTMKTGGDDVAYILWLLGVRPVWSSTGGQVVDLEVIPLKELGRPRVDVSVNITGLFRDTFPNLIDMIDDAVKLVAGLDESDEDNALAANLRKDIIDDITEGLTPDEARRRNCVRIFGAPPGGYGTGVNKAIESGAWKTVQDLADVYIDWCSNGYEKGNYGQKMRTEFIRRFSKVGVTVKNMPDREIDLLDCDDVYEYLGGMNSFVRAYGRKDAMTIMGDGSDPKKTKVRNTKEELRFAFRSKVLNPKFINGLKEHGYRGAAEMANLTEYTMAWGATSDVAEDWMYEGITDKFLLDKDTHDWMEDVNPYAMMNILNRLQEAIERGLWNATDEYKQKIMELYMKTEERIEEITDR